MLKGFSQKLMGKMIPGADELMALQEQLKKTTITGQAANGSVKVTLKGTMELENVKIDEEYLRQVDAKTLSKDIKKAYKNAVSELQKQLRKSLLG